MSLEFLGLLGALLATIAAGFSTYRLSTKQEAEHRLLASLTKNQSYIRWLRMNRNLLTHARNQRLSVDELQELTKYLLDAVKQLDKNDRHALLEAIHQPSAQGRANYAAKLITESAEQDRSVVRAGD